MAVRAARIEVAAARVVAVLAVVLVAAAFLVIARAVAVERSRAAVAAQTIALERGDAVPEMPAPRPTAPATAALNHALVASRWAAATRDPARRGRWLARAQVDLATAQAARPHWGESALVAAYLLLARGAPAEGPAFVALLSRSYRDAPMLRDARGWRVAVALPLYRRLPSDVRPRVVEEAIWLARADHAMAPGMFALARRSAGYGDVLARWITLRRGDADQIAGQRPTP